MDWKKEYDKVVETICKRKNTIETNIFEVEPPECFFNGKTYDTQDDSLITKRLFEEIAEEKDYKDFCIYAYNKIGLDTDKQFTNFGRK